MALEEKELEDISSDLYQKMFLGMDYFFDKRRELGLTEFDKATICTRAISQIIALAIFSTRPEFIDRILALDEVYNLIEKTMEQMEQTK